MAIDDFKRNGVAAFVAFVAFLWTCQSALGQVTWLPDADGNWGVAANWSSNPNLPGATDNVVINVGGSAVRAITHSAGVDSIATLETSERVRITGGVLTATQGVSLRPDGEIVASNSGVFRAGGAVNSNSGGFFANTGGQIILQSAVGFSDGALNRTIFRADNAGSLLDWPSLTTFTGKVSGANSQILAFTGGKVDLKNLSSVAGGAVDIQAQNAGSTIDLTALTSISDTNTNDFTRLWARDGSEILTPNLTTVNDVVLAVEGTGKLGTSKIVSLNKAEAYAGLGGVISFPMVTSIQDQSANRNIFRADNPGSVVSLTSVTSYTGRLTGPNSQVLTFTGGKVDLKNLTSIPGGAVNIEAQNAGSIIDLTALTSVTDTNPNDFTRLWARDGSQILTPNLTTVNDAILAVEGTGKLGTSKVTSLNKAEAYAGLGGTISFPMVTSIQDQSANRNIFRADNAGSVVDLSNVTSFTGRLTGPNSQVLTFTGGKVDLKNVTSIPGGAVNIEAQSVGSIIDLTALTSVTDTNPNDFTRLWARDGSQILTPNLTTVNDVVLAVEGTGKLGTSKIVSLNKAEAYAGLGGTISFPLVTSIQDQSANRTVFRADNPASVVDLSNVTTYTGRLTGPNSQVLTFTGGKVDLKNVTSIPGGAVNIEAQNAGSIIDLTALTSVTDTNPHDFTRLWARDGSQILTPNLTTVNDVVLAVEGTGKLGTSKITSLNKAEAYAGLGGVISFPMVTSIQDQSANRNIFRADNSGSVVDLSNVTSFTGRLTGPNSQVLTFTGGKVDFKNLTTIPGGAVRLESHGPGSLIDMSSLANFTDNNPNDNSLLWAEGQGEIRLANQLIPLTGVDVAVTNQGNITAGGLQLLAGSTLQGPSTLNADVVNTLGLVVPDAVRAGSFTINGAFTQGDQGTMGIRFNGESVGQFGFINVAESATLAGRIDLSFANGLNITLGESYKILQAASISGGIDNGGAAVSNEAFLTPVVKNNALYLLAALAGDSDLDGDVDLNDFARLRTNFNTGGAGRLKGDNTGDGLVNLTDFGRLRSNFNRKNGPTAASIPGPPQLVPEPSLAIHALLLTVLTLAAKVRHKAAR